MRHITCIPKSIKTPHNGNIQTGNSSYVHNTMGIIIRWRPINPAITPVMSYGTSLEEGEKLTQDETFSYKNDYDIKSRIFKNEIDFLKATLDINTLGGFYFIFSFLALDRYV